MSARASRFSFWLRAGCIFAVSGLAGLSSVHAQVLTPRAAPAPAPVPTPAPQPVKSEPEPVKPSDPARLVELRNQYQSALHRVVEPLDKSYVETLTTLQRQFSKNGDLENALAVRREVERMNQSIEANARGPELVILSAQQRDVATGKNVVDVTKQVKENLYSGKATMGLNAYRDVGTRLSTPPPRRETFIIYSYGGEKKEKTFPERAELNFVKDLR